MTTSLFLNSTQHFPLSTTCGICRETFRKKDSDNHFLIVDHTRLSHNPYQVKHLYHVTCLQSKARDPEETARLFNVKIENISQLFQCAIKDSQQLYRNRLYSALKGAIPGFQIGVAVLAGMILTCQLSGMIGLLTGTAISIPLGTYDILSGGQDFFELSNKTAYAVNQLVIAFLGGAYIGKALAAGAIMLKNRQIRVDPSAKALEIYEKFKLSVFFEVGKTAALASMGLLFVHLSNVFSLPWALRIGTSIETVKKINMATASLGFLSGGLFGLN